MNGERRIIANMIKTPDGTILQSYNRHDYKTYTDKNGHEYMVDGGSDYLRRNLVEEAPYEELSVYSDAPFQLIRKYFCRGGRGKDGRQPITYVPLNEMSNEWVKSCIIYNDERGLGESFASEMYLQELEYRKKHKIVIAD